MEQVDRSSFLRLAGAGAAGTALLRPGAAARAAQVRAAGHGPNVLVIVIDSLRADHVGAYGNSWIHTPSIDALAAESLRFARAFPEAMPTVPARRSLMLGRRTYPWRGWKPVRGLPGTPGWAGLSVHDTTWLRTLREHGYWTGYVTDNPFLGFSPPWEGLRRSVDHFLPISGQVGIRHPPSSIPLSEVLRWLPADMHRSHRYVTGMREHLANTGAGRDDQEAQQCAARVFSHAIGELGQAAKRQPFALVVDSFDPHEPWDPPRHYIDLYGDPKYHGDEPGTVRYQRSSYLTAAELKRLPALYAGAVTMADTWLGRFMEKFHALGLAEDTVVVLLSDHGILLGERGWTGKPALELHPELIQVPFLLRDPSRRAAGQVTPYFVSPHDVGPTVLSMAGVAKPNVMDGADLSPLLAGAQPSHARPFAYGGYANHWYYRDDNWALIADGNNTGRELFDLHADAGELHNVAHQHTNVLRTIYRNVLHDAHLPRLPFFGQAH
jgi:arylsulfatase A-like enzyme